MPVCTIPIMILTFPIRINCVSRFFCNFADETSRAVAFSGLANRAFYVPRWSRYDVEDNVKLQKQRRMEKNLLSQFASQFAEASLSSLVESFNAQVGNRGFNSARAAHDHTLIDELVRRGVDVSAISDGHSISFAHHVALDESAMKLVIQG